MKHRNYFPIYDELLEKYIGSEITFVEIGVLNGGSLFMWRDFFGPNARVIGIDYNPNALKWKEEGFEIFIGDQSSKEFWQHFYDTVGEVDIVLDDGGHTNKQQIVTVLESLPFVKNGGKIIVEDTHASYLPEFGNPSRYSFSNYAKRLADKIQSRFPEVSALRSSDESKSIHSITYYESIIAISIDKRLALENQSILNSGESDGAEDYRNHGTLTNSIKSILLKFGIRKLVPRRFEVKIRFIFMWLKNFELIKYW